MSRLYYDFHVHSCLSPCAEDESTPQCLAGFGRLCGLSLMALTDHNSCKNCPAFFQAAAAYGLVPIAGMELETAEEIHVVCLFETLAEAVAFDQAVAIRRRRIPNRRDIFGAQRVVDSEDCLLEEEPWLLATATELSLQEVPALVSAYGGICYPAHIDRTANGILSILGTFPPEVPFRYAELHSTTQAQHLLQQYPSLRDKRLLYGSDTHAAAMLPEATAYLELDVPTDDAAAVRKALFSALREGKV